jgi:hypothetical protein
MKTYKIFFARVFGARGLIQSFLAKNKIKSYNWYYWKFQDIRDLTFCLTDITKDSKDRSTSVLWVQQSATNTLKAKAVRPLET